MNDRLQAPASAIPPDVLCAQDYERLAPLYLAPATLAYIEGGSGQDVTAQANVHAFARWAVLPRVLCDVSQGHTRVTLAGQALAHPVLLAPLALQKLAHPRGEVETARGAGATDTLMLCSTLSTCTLEEVARVGAAPRWFQLYLQPTREATLALVRRAEAAGYQAIVLTLDAAVQAPSLSALRAGFSMPRDCMPVNLAGQAVAAPAAVAEGQSAVLQGLMRLAPSWDDVDWLLGQTQLPVWAKGVLHPDDAVALKARGVAGLVVSNHGGRSLDGAPASLLMLPGVRAAVGDGLPLVLDGGVRSGADVFKALALGADAVAVGRLQVYALAVAGALGVAHMLKLLRDELELCMAAAGCATLADITPDALREV